MYVAQKENMHQVNYVRLFVYLKILKKSVKKNYFCNMSNLKKNKKMSPSQQYFFRVSVSYSCARPVVVMTAMLAKIL